MRIAQQTKTRSRLARRLVFARQVIVLTAVMALTACRPNPPSSPVLRQVTDELGRQVAIVKAPQRIISLAPSVTETLFALGAEAKLIAVTSYCDYPPETKTKEKIGDTQRPNIERIVALKPDLVIASTASQLEAFVRALENAGIPVYVSNPRNLEDALRSILAIGDITGAREQGEALTKQLQARIDQVRHRVAGKTTPSVFVMLGAQPLITIGKGSFMTDLLTRAGGRSISETEASDYPQFSLETVIARQPEVIFLQAGEEPLPERLRQTPAARQGRIYHIDDDLLMRPGPRIVAGLEALAAKIHPEP